MIKLRKKIQWEGPDRPQDEITGWLQASQKEVGTYDMKYFSIYNHIYLSAWSFIGHENGAGCFCLISSSFLSFLHSFLCPRVLAGWHQPHHHVPASSSFLLGPGKDFIPLLSQGRAGKQIGCTISCGSPILLYSPIPL